MPGTIMLKWQVRTIGTSLAKTVEFSRALFTLLTLVTGYCKISLHKDGTARSWWKRVR